MLHIGIGRWPRWLRRLAGGALGLALLLALFVGWALLFCFAEPPVLAARPALLDLEARHTEDGRVHLGASWYQPAEGRSLLYLEGSPFELGYANARLTHDLLAFQEKSLIDTVEAKFPSLLKRIGLGLLVLVNNRNLPDYVQPEYALEILGLSQGGPEDQYGYLGPRYHRILNYHAAHDISHWVWDKPVLGCTAFAARGAASLDGGLLVARNFDWEAGEHFDRNKVIALYRPEAGLAFLSVSWPGMAGAVTGINAERIFCSVNGAHSEQRSNIGRPVSLVVREVLQYAQDLEQAIEIVAGAEIFVSDSYLIADGETGEAVVVERAPGKSALRRLEGELLIQANHFETPEFADDAGNAEYMRVGSSRARHARTSELCEAARGQLDVERAVAILRDRDGPGGAPRALGHRGTINPMIATHSVVADVTRGVLWVSRGPHQLGAFDPYSIEGFGEGPPADLAPVPADPALEDGSYARLVEQRRLMEGIESALEGNGRLGPDELARLERAHELSPDDPGILLLLARARELEGDNSRAAALYAAALEAVPPFEPHVEAARAALERLRGGGS